MTARDFAGSMLSSGRNIGRSQEGTAKTRSGQMTSGKVTSGKLIPSQSTSLQSKSRTISKSVGDRRLIDLLKRELEGRFFSLITNMP
jgi:hypothetical protein